MRTKFPTNDDGEGGGNDGDDKGVLRVQRVWGKQGLWDVRCVWGAERGRCAENGEKEPKVLGFCNATNVSSRSWQLQH